MKRLVAIFILSLSPFIYGQSDTLWVKNGNVLYGEIKGLSAGVITMETSYSDDDFTIDFDEVEGLSIQRKCIIILSGGRRVLGYLRSENPAKVTLRETDSVSTELDLLQVTSLQQVKERIWNRFSGNIDLGFNLTKANNNRQLTVSGGVHYRGLKWLADATVSSLRSERDDVARVERNSVNLGAVRLLSDNWYLLGSWSFLSNTEQQLVGRYSLRFGPGRYLAINHKLFWGISAGINGNVEDFEGNEFDKESSEVFISTSLDLFDFKDFSLYTSLMVYPSLSEKDRLRIDYLLNLKYDLPWDFYIKTGFQFNYDNQAVESDREFDYVLTSGLGWSFN